MEVLENNRVPLKESRLTLPTEISQDSVTTSNKSEICDVFNKYFVAAGCISQCSVPHVLASHTNISTNTGAHGVYLRHSASFAVFSALGCRDLLKPTGADNMNLMLSLLRLMYCCIYCKYLLTVFPTCAVTPLCNVVI